MKLSRKLLIRNATSLEAEMRINLAGEKAATIIAHQHFSRATNFDIKNELARNLRQEREHLSFFEERKKIEKFRASALSNIWEKIAKIGGFLTITAGNEIAMRCCEGIEKVIHNHYSEQLIFLETQYPKEKNLIENIRKFRDEEASHQEEAKLLADQHKHSIAGNIVRDITSLCCKIAIKITGKI